MIFAYVDNKQANKFIFETTATAANKLKVKTQNAQNRKKKF